MTDPIVKFIKDIVSVRGHIKEIFANNAQREDFEKYAAAKMDMLRSAAEIHQIVMDSGFSSPTALALLGNNTKLRTLVGPASADFQTVKQETARIKVELPDATEEELLMASALKADPRALLAEDDRLKLALSGVLITEATKSLLEEQSPETILAIESLEM